MFANFKFARVFAVALLPLLLPFSLKGECAPQISTFSQNLSLDYFFEEDTPNNIATIDVVLGDGSMDGNYSVVKVNTSWKTTGFDFTGVTLTGTITINYNDGTPSQDCAYINGVFNNPLPIELSIFNGHLMDNDVFLNWSTESESENAGFEIERSFDGESFERIAFQNGAGDSEEKLWYSFVDYDVKNIALGKAVYYRLKQINYDQTFWYSQVVVVDLKIDIEGFEITKILGWNNPDRIIKVYFHNPATIRKINISVATINGQLIEQKSIYPQTGFNFFEIDLSGQKENLFFIALNNGKQTTVEKLILHPPY
jgi:hypothetical protein